MTQDELGNYIRAQRRKFGLTQRELGLLIGYAHGHAVSMHERSTQAPPLLIALAYEIVFEIPVARLFTGFHSAVIQSVAGNIQNLKAEIEGRAGASDFKKSQWLLQLHQRIAA